MQAICCVTSWDTGTCGHGHANCRLVKANYGAFVSRHAEERVDGHLGREGGSIYGAPGPWKRVQKQKKNMTEKVKGGLKLGEDQPRFTHC